MDPILPIFMLFWSQSGNAVAECLPAVIRYADPLNPEWKNRVSQENRHVMIAGANQCWRIGSGTLGGRHDHLAPPPAHRVNEFRYRSYFYFTWKASTEPG